jgi:hypothetical protein
VRRNMRNSARNIISRRRNINPVCNYVRRKGEIWRGEKL